MVPNYVKLRNNLIDQMDKDFVMKNKFLHRKRNQKIAYSDKYAFDLQTRLL